MAARGNSHARSAHLRIVASGLVTLLAVCAFLAYSTADAGALIPSAQVLGVPGGNVFEAGDVAVSEDGTGGAVFVAVTGGKRHVFASRLRNGQWSAPLQVDVGMQFDAFAPRIGAGDGGRLVVVWVERGPADATARHDQLYSASLDPGATVFEPPVLVDFDVGSADAAFPDLEMNAAGTAYLVYRHLVAAKNYGTPPPGVSVPDGDAFAYTRVARYNGWLWSRFDQPVNRNAVATVRFPSEDNAPKVAIAASGTGAVAFQEPDASGYSRVWVRKLFGSSPGLPQLASLTEYGGAPLLADADAIALTLSRPGGLGVAFRQNVGGQSRLDRARIMSNRIADPSDVLSVATNFVGVKLADTAPGSADAVPGRPYLRMKKDAAYDLAYGLQGTAYAQRSTQQTEYPSNGWAPAGSGDSQDVYSSVSDDETSVQASIDGAGVRLVDGSTGTSALVGAVDGGAIENLGFAANNSGDAAIAALQETPAGRRMLLATIDSPPDPFQVNVRSSWIRTPKPGVTWIRLTDGSGPLRYEIFVDKKFQTSTFEDSVSLGKLKDGRHQVAVWAIDGAGQALRRPSFTVRIDRRAPSVRVKRLRGRVRVTLDDGPKRRSSGLGSKSRVFWVRGKSSLLRKGSATYRFKQSGTHLIRVVAYDKAGNRVTVRRKVRT
ncbi:MAG: hypothetical protein JHC98_05265 [Thermoleophilaceae bacterium]|nr:hypothetical protein [Thermoleophilaceae bacterium]